MRPICLVVLLASLAVAETARPEEQTFPTPPQQNAPWTPPETSLPKFLVNAASSLFEQGLADPRGCEYRSIRITVGHVWGGEGGEVETSGWVLPSDDGKPRYAIAWSGLVYPLVSAGGPAELDGDITALVEAQIPPEGQPRTRHGFNGFGSNNEASSVVAKSLVPMKVCLLLRIGRADLAERIWAAGTGRPKTDGPRPKLDLTSYGISYLTLAQDLAWYRFDRAICAHMRGDDVIALADTRALTAFDRAVEVKADAMGFPRKHSSGQAEQVPPYIDFLRQLPEFIDDQERRAKERAEALANPPRAGWEDRIAKRIHELDQVAARQWGQPGGVALGESPIIKDLIEAGDAAVQPLIDDFRTERRLTRSVQFHRDFFRNRQILGADRAAYAALTGILKTTNFAPAAPAGADRKVPTRQELADQIQAYWDENKWISLADRWYRTLADEKAGNDAWLEVAGYMVQPENVKTITGGAFVVTETTPLKPGEAPAMRGEPLRKEHEPSVSALMARRLEQMLKSPEGQRFELSEPCRMAGFLAAWDPVAAVPTLRELSRICRDRYAKPDNGRDWANQNLAVSIARFTVSRDEAGDHEALHEYAAWIRTVSPSWLDHNAAAVLEPFTRRPDDPELASAASWLFNDPKSPWVPLVGREGSQPSFHTVQMIGSSLVEVPAFRTMLLRSLEDRSPLGSASISQDELVSIKIGSGFSFGRSAPKSDPDPPGVGTETPLRVCDLYAWQISGVPGTPVFNPCWAEPRRDAAVRAIADYLKRKSLP